MSEVTVRVRFYNVLADYAGCKRAEVRVPAGTTVEGLVQYLAETNSEAFRQAVLSGGRLNTYLRLFRDDRLLAEEDLQQPLSEGQEFHLFPAVAGG